jgi:crossover junction endodeoxyribonuclease RusA
MTTGYEWALARTTAALKAETGRTSPDDGKIILPYPSAALSPNARGHWAKKARAFKAYKNACILAMTEKRASLRGKSRFVVTFQMPDNRARDIDNAIASFKAGCDALAFVTRVDDSKFSIEWRRGDVTPGGAVVVEVVE